MTKNRTPTPVYLDPGMHPGLEVKGLKTAIVVISVVRVNKNYCASLFRTNFKSGQCQEVGGSFYLWQPSSHRIHSEAREARDKRDIVGRCGYEGSENMGKIKWNEWGCRPCLSTCRLNWAKRTSWWWDEWGDTALQTQYFKFKPWRSDAEHATSRSRRFPTISNQYEWVGNKHFVSLKPKCQSDLQLSKQTALTTVPGNIGRWGTYHMFLRETKEIRGITKAVSLTIAPDPYKVELFLFNPWRQDGYFQFEIIMSVSVSSFWFIWIPMSWVYSR